jgi:hypothetical protein
MATDNLPNLSGVFAQNLEHARRAMDSYLQFWDQALSATPWGKNEAARKLAGYAQQNIAKSFEVAQRLAQAKDVQDIVQIQTEFFQSQMQLMNEQAKDIGSTIVQKDPPSKQSSKS